MDLDLQDYRKIKGQKLGRIDKEKGVICCKKCWGVLTKLKLLFTNEKLFKVQALLNTQSNRIFAKRRKKKQILDKRLYIEYKASHKSAIISVVISMYGKASILFVDPKVRMNGVHYCTLVLKMFIPQMSRLCPNFILEQDGTRCYIPAYALPYIGPHVPQLLEPEFWSPPSPDLNPLNYCLWDYVETVIRNHQNVGDFDQLKTKIAKSWKTIS